jgi:hypothetical protein
MKRKLAVAIGDSTSLSGPNIPGAVIACKFHKFTLTAKL